MTLDARQASPARSGCSSCGRVPLIVFFSVAGFIHHAHDPWARRELAFVCGLVFLALLSLGGGRFSLDAVLGQGGRGVRFVCRNMLQYKAL